MDAFEDGRQYEGLVRQIRSIHTEIDTAKDRVGMKRAMRHVLDDIFPKFLALAEKYKSLDDLEVIHVSRLHARCVSENGLAADLDYASSKAALEYQGEWIAVKDQQVLAHNLKRETVVQEMSDKGIDAVIDYVGGEDFSY